MLSKPARGAALMLAAVIWVSSCSADGDGADAGSGASPSGPASSSAAADSSEGAGSDDSAAGAEATGSDAASPDSAGGPTQRPYLPVPDGVELTPQGSLLALGKPADVAFRDRSRTPPRIAALRLRVDELQRTTFAASFDGWKLTADVRRTTPYFVSVRVRNLGRSRLGGTGVPLYALDSKNELIQALSFADDFEPCPSEPLPRGFGNGDRATVCLAYLVPKGRKLEGITFRPVKDFEAITWTGDVTGPGAQRSRGADRRGQDRG